MLVKKIVDSIPTEVNKYNRFNIDKDIPKLTTEELTALVEHVRLIGYARVSTVDQAERGWSLESQIESIYSKAKEEGFQDQQILIVVEMGKSGDDPDRPALNFVLGLIKDGVGNGGKFVCLHPDRFSRSFFQGMSIYYEITNYGIDVNYIEFDYDPDNPESALMYNIHMSIAQYNKSKILANSKRGRRQKLKSGEIPGIRKIFGYDFDKETDKLVENPEEKEIYQLMVDWILNGKDGREMTCSKIAKELAKLGYKPPESNVWYQTTVSRVLRCETYKGFIYFGKSEIIQKNGKKVEIEKPKEEWFKIPVPAYIDEPTWNRVQEELDKREKRHRGRPSMHHLLKGLVRCGRCGASVASGGHSFTKNNKYYYYACTRKSTKGWVQKTGESYYQRCKGSNWRTDIIDPLIWNWVIDHLKEPEKIIQTFLEKQGNPHEIQEMQDKLSRLQSTLKDREGEKERLIFMFQKKWITPEEMNRKMEDVMKEIMEVQEEVDLLQNSLNNLLKEFDSFELLKSKLRQFYKYVTKQEHLTDQLKREILGIFINRVILYDDKVEIYAKWGEGLKVMNESGAPDPVQAIDQKFLSNRHRNYKSSQIHGRQ
ncbi:recombinase family protein [Fodinisporobacter ferrooxydans]|uniref:Recombinase family protein n=1 Tax=Fodinisporobacter ferrooxydans TaxID=2901836 RepID=A0ABY4CJA6_9BACL|nr:recombinase family protein [Alicyclobacillaceae bacterium MYW30-H2]